ncbi:glycoside hydrolase family 99-like domain-containing protein [[Eubacterium] hominis]|uniref:glycosyltransferase WbsX family protein n=1 Tax=[Eubacterium] hominis TaxID=2764325 RepID=UPI003A4D3275
MKILAIYLPAFHREIFNDMAWGKGFTEWNNVKNGKKLYKGHIQPLIPLNDNYYDLSNKESIETQIKIAKQNKIDGFIFYHYWFGNDKKALYKPAEIMKNEIKEEFTYCFCWANHSWIKNWHDKSNETIVNQIYGDEKEWDKHIKYLIPFFKDEKYIKIDGRPVLYIYNMNDIKCFDKMLDYWNTSLKNNDIKPIYIVEYISARNKKNNCKKTEAVVEFEPLYTTFFDITFIQKLKRFLCKKLNKIDFQDYDYIWNKIINRKRTYNGINIQKGCFVKWDNSARKGHNCMIVKNDTPDKFKKNLESLINNNRKDSSNDFVVINAWNEWSEGAVLEPDQHYKYAYLESVKKAVENYEE